jgi:hypothetical protein
MNSGDMACCVYVVFEKNKESPMYCGDTHVDGLLHIYPFYPFLPMSSIQRSRRVGFVFGAQMEPGIHEANIANKRRGMSQSRTGNWQFVNIQHSDPCRDRTSILKELRTPLEAFQNETKVQGNRHAVKAVDQLLSCNWGLAHVRHFSRAALPYEFWYP